MDFGVGIVLSVLIAKAYGVALDVRIILAGAFFSVLPDVDIALELLKRGKVGGKEHGLHREYTHYPILYVPLCLFTLIFFGSFWAVLLALCLFFHTLHDSVWMGWGLKLLWPFSNRNYKFFASQLDGTWSRSLVTSWSKKELELVTKKYGDDKWFGKYIRFSKTLVIEIMVFLVAVFYVFVQFVDK